MFTVCVCTLSVCMYMYMSGGVGQGSRATIFAESADWIPYIISFIDSLLLANCCICQLYTCLCLEVHL